MPHQWCVPVHWLFRVSQHHTLSPRRPSQGWSDPGLLPSNIRSQITPLYPQPSGGSLGFVSHNPDGGNVCCPTDGQHVVESRQRAAYTSSAAYFYRMAAGLLLSPTFFHKSLIIGTASLISCVTTPVRSSYPDIPATPPFCTELSMSLFFNRKSVKRLDVTLQNILPSTLSNEIELSCSRFVGFSYVGIQTPFGIDGLCLAFNLSVRNLWTTFD